MVGSVTSQQNKKGACMATGTCATIVARWWLPLSLMVLLLSTISSAHANPRYAGIVVDLENGEVLYAENADERRYPASLTKMMTLYLTFEALEKRPAQS